MAVKVKERKKERVETFRITNISAVADDDQPNVSHDCDGDSDMGPLFIVVVVSLFLFLLKQNQKKNHY